MVVALVQIVPLQLSKEYRHQLLLLLNLEATELQFDILEVGHQDDQEFQSRIHCEFSKHDWRRIESKTHFDIMNIKFLKVNLLLNLNLSTWLIIWLFEIIKSFLDLVDIIDILVVKLLLFVFVLGLIFLCLLDDVRAISEHFVAKVSIEVEIERNQHQVEISEEVQIFDGLIFHVLHLQVEEVLSG